MLGHADASLSPECYDLRIGDIAVGITRSLAEATINPTSLIGDF